MVLNVPEGGGGIGYSLAMLTIAFGPPLLVIALVVGVAWFFIRRRRRRQAESMQLPPD